MKEYPIFGHSFNRLGNSLKKYLFWTFCYGDIYVFILLHGFNNVIIQWVFIVWVLFLRHYSSKKSTTWSRNIRYFVVPNCCEGIQKAHKVITWNI